MKISKRIFSFLVSLLMITSSVGVATATEATDTTNGETYHIDISSEFNMDGIASVGDTLKNDTWMNGKTYGFPASLFTAENGLVKFSAKSLDKKDPNGKVEKANLQSVAVPSTDNAEFLIPQVGLEGGVNDNVFIAANTEKTFTLKEGATNIDKIRIALHMYNNASFTFTVNYSDNTSDIVKTDGEFQAFLRDANWNAVNWYIGKPVRRFCWKQTSSAIKINDNGVAEKSGEAQHDAEWGIAGYQIPVDKTKTPVSLTVKATNPISVFAINECQLYNEEMKFVVDEVKAYGTGIAYTTAQIEKIELAKKYAEVLEERNVISSDDKATVATIYNRAMELKQYTGKPIHFDISDKYNADTIAKIGDIVGDKWFLNGPTLNDNNWNGMRGEWFGDETIFNVSGVEVFIPNVGRSGGVDDTYALYNADGHRELEIDLNNIYTSNIRIVALGCEANINAKIFYDDGTTEEKSVYATNLATHNWSLYTKDMVYMWTGKFAIKGNDNVIYEGNSGNAGAGIYTYETDFTKAIDKVVFSNSSSRNTAYMYSVSQTPINLAEMQANVESAKALESYVGLLTSEQIESINKAVENSAMLVKLGIGTEEDYAFLDSLVENANKQKAIVNDGITYLDFKKDYNISTIGATGETVGDNWNKVSCKNIRADAILNKDDYLDFEEYAEYDGASVKQTGNTIKAYIPESVKKATVNDSVNINTTDGYTTKLSNVFTKSIYFVSNTSGGGAKVNVVVTYSDGTTTEKKVNTNDRGQVGYYKNGPNASAGGRIDYPDFIAIKDVPYEVALDTGEKTLKNGTTWDNGFMMYKVALDEKKIPVSIKFFATESTNPVMIYAINQNAVTFTELKKVLDEGLEAGVMTKEDEATLETLKAYNNFLVGMGAIASDTYGTKIANYEKQANAQKASYVDLSKYVNADLIVKVGDTYSDTDSAKLAREIELFNADILTSDILTVVEPSDKKYADDASQVEVGRTYKLNGGYNGKGNDVVQVKKDDEAGKNTVTIPLPETVGTVNGIGVILDANHGSNSPNWDSTANIYVNNGTTTGRTVPVTINYADGTKETVNVVLVKSTAYQMSKFYANAGSTNRLDYGATETDLTAKVRAMSGGGMNSPFFYSSNIAFDTTKTVESLTFGSIINGDYNIVAISQFVQTNEEILNIVDDQNLGVEKTEDITAENVDAAIKWLNACIELYNRGFYDIVTEEDYVAFSEMLDYAKALKAGNTGFTAEIAIADGDNETKVATFNMSNMTTADQDYVLVIASYVGNKLVGLNVSQTGKVTSGETKTDSITLTKGTDANTTYKAFVWESLSDLKPLASSK